MGAGRIATWPSRRSSWPRAGSVTFWISDAGEAFAPPATAAPCPRPSPRPTSSRRADSRGRSSSPASGSSASRPAFSCRSTSPSCRTPVRTRPIHSSTSPSCTGPSRVVTRSGAVSTYATNLLNFDPLGSFPGSGEKGTDGHRRRAFVRRPLRRDSRGAAERDRLPLSDGRPAPQPGRRPHGSQPHDDPRFPERSARRVAPDLERVDRSGRQALRAHRRRSVRADAGAGHDLGAGQDPAGQPRRDRSDGQSLLRRDGGAGGEEPDLRPRPAQSLRRRLASRRRRAVGSRERAERRSPRQGRRRPQLSL